MSKHNLVSKEISKLNIREIENSDLLLVLWYTIININSASYCMGADSIALKIILK